MEANMQTALLLMMIGMVTVFAILLLVVLCSKLMIIIINTYFQELIDIEPLPHPSRGHMHDPKKISIIIAAVEAITAGKGRIKEIRKMDNK